MCFTTPQPKFPMRRTTENSKFQISSIGGQAVFFIVRVSGRGFYFVYCKACPSISCHYSVRHFELHFLLEKCRINKVLI